MIYLAEFAQMQLGGTDHLVLVDTVEPVSFFAYPDKPCGSSTTTATGPTLAGGVPTRSPRWSGWPVSSVHPHRRSARSPGPEAPSGPSTPAAGRRHRPYASRPRHRRRRGQHLGLSPPRRTAAGPPHDWLCLTGGSIGIGLPLVGAAVAAPDRRVVAVQADGSAMYTLQALWTMAREQLDVTVVIADTAGTRCSTWS
ncbi:MAG: thiamine pyrophosphate-dependent enzyme [Acidimicrobiales bacterium]